MELIGQTFADVVELDLNIDDLNWKQLDYLVGLGMEEVGGLFEVHHPKQVHDQDLAWPSYHSSGKHAMRLMEAFPPNKLIMPKGIIVEIACNRSGTSTYEKSSEFRNCKKELTKAGAKLVLEEGEKLADNHRRKMRHR